MDLLFEEELSTSVLLMFFASVILYENKTPGVVACPFFPGFVKIPLLSVNTVSLYVINLENC